MTNNSKIKEENMIIKNATVRGFDESVDILIIDGKIEKIEDSIEADCKIVDANGGLVLPPFIEPHIHLDTTLTAGEPKWNESGTLFEGIELWSERKTILTKEDVKTRAKRQFSGK